MITELDENAQRRVMTYLNERFAPILPMVPAALLERALENAGGSDGSTRSRPSSEGKPRRKSDYELLKDFQLNASGKEALKPFYNRFVLKKYPERHAVIVYYLEKMLGAESVNLSMVFTAYKHLKVKPPKDLYQSFLQSSSQNKYFSTTDINDIRIQPAGIALVESGSLAKQPGEKEE